MRCRAAQTQEKKLLGKSDLEIHHFSLVSKENKFTLQGAAVFFQCADSDLPPSPYVQAGKCSSLREVSAFSQRARVQSGHVRARTPTHPLSSPVTAVG